MVIKKHLIKNMKRFLYLAECFVFRVGIFFLLFLLFLFFIINILIFKETYMMNMSRQLNISILKKSKIDSYYENILFN
jgi:hypothetical protein